MSGSTHRARFNAALAQTTLPVFLLNARREVIGFNTGCETLTGWGANEILRQRCDYSPEPNLDSFHALTNTLCPPPEVFSGTPASVPANFSHKEGRSFPRLIHFFPMQDESGHTTRVLGIVTTLDQPLSTTRPTIAQQLHAELASVRNSLRQRYQLTSLIGQCPAMQRVMQQLTVARQTNGSVLLHGESGTGKEHLARMIHYESEHPEKAFVPLDCKLLPRRELRRTLKRICEQAANPESQLPGRQPGRVYLGRLEHLTGEVQEQLLESIETYPEMPLRFLAGSAEDPETLLQSERLLPELYFFLTPLVIHLPPLRDRQPDLLPLAQYFLEQANRVTDQQVGGFSEAVTQQLQQYNWPGNLDELASVIREARDVCEGSLVETDHLPFRFRTGMDAQTVGPKWSPPDRSLEELLEDYEREQIQQTLAFTRQNKSKAAELLGLTRAKFYRRLEQLGIEESAED